MNAVISRATKQKPLIRQIKILKDSKVRKEGEKSRPRGVAFLEFTEHQHALVALRGLNNNPDIFDPEHRPIVEFALDNVQKLKLRAEKIQAQQLQGPQYARGNFQQIDHLGRGGSIANLNSRIRKSRDGDISMRTYDNKRGELVSKGMVAEEGSNKWQKGPRKVAKSRVSLPKKKSSMQVSDQGNGKESGGQELKQSNTVSKKEGRDGGMPRKRMPRELLEQSTEGDGGERNRKRRKRSELIGSDVTDKLDKLIEQYRTKFTGSSSTQSGSKKQGTKSRKRWFQS
ncbi:RNA-binding protein 28-like [Salvia divinorum]